MDTRFKLTRVVRTPASEIYLVWDGDRRTGQADIHYAGDTVHATLTLEEDVPAADEEELVRQIDDEVVTSYMLRFEREDFVVHVFRGTEINRYTDTVAPIDEPTDDADGEP